ncbi:NlpC/P60 family protein [Sphaerisporangium sp. NPDC005288]|uniref:bifunctional WXG100 family type VII secretion target/C40 family peptidase n=1 Tax=unclassified Sphaerisporangium TaxID=2630420 RepID=UPI0033B47645
MTDADAVAALPEGQELAALLKKTDGDPAAVEAIAKRWRTAASGSVEKLRALGTALRTMDDAWEGDSADAFVAYMNRYGRAGDSLREVLVNCAGCLDSAAGAVRTARKNVVQTCDDLLAWVAEYRRLNPHATEDQLKPGITREVRLAVHKAKEQVETAETALSTARTDIGKHVGQAYPTFASIPAADRQAFVPGPGHTTEWRPTPLDPKRTTTLAGTDTPPGATPVTYGGDSGGGSGGGQGGGQGGGAAPRAIPFEVTGNGTGADIVAAARSHLGKPYVWGADGPDAFDCSGLVHASLNEAGIKIGDATAAGYWASGKPITGPPQPGDIVFFGEPPTHCAVYMGDGKMIAAPHSGDVVKIQDVAGRQPISFRRFT